MRDYLKTEDALKISFRDLYRDAFDGLWLTLLKLYLSDEALYAAERSRAQALVDGLKIHYGLTVLKSTTIEPKAIISYISNLFPTRTVFLALKYNIITLWVVNKESKVEIRQKEIDGRRGHHDSINDLLETTLKKIGAGVGVKSENRSLEPTDDSPSDRGGNEQPAQTLQCTIDSLQPLHEAIIGPIADLCQGDELIIVPDGPLCLAPFSALSESIRIRTVPSLTSLKLIIDSPEDYHRKSGALLVGDPCLEKVLKEGIWEIKPMYT